MPGSSSLLTASLPLPSPFPCPATCAAACAAAGDADKAFQLYAEMKATGVPADRMVYSSVVKACAERIERLPPSERCARGLLAVL